MSSSKYELTGKVTIGNILHIKEMGLPARIITSVAEQLKCKNINCKRTIFPKCPHCGAENTYSLTLEVQSQVYMLGKINFQTKINPYDTNKIMLFVGLQSKDVNVHDVCISSNRLQLCGFLKAKPGKECMEWHAIYNAGTVSDINSWKFDMEVALVTDNVNHLTAAPLLNSVLEDDNTADVELIGMDGSVRAHGCLLAAASPFLRAAFYGDFTEAREKRLNVPDANVAALKIIKKYAYTSFVDAEPEMMVMLLPLASRFLMPSLARACANALYGILPDDLIPLLQINLKPPSTEKKENENPQPSLPQLEMLSRNDNKEALKNVTETGAGDYNGY